MRCKAEVPYRRRDMICDDCRQRIEDVDKTMAVLTGIYGYVPWWWLRQTIPKE